jgi:hypothetical protein
MKLRNIYEDRCRSFSSEVGTMESCQLIGGANHADVRFWTVKHQVKDSR